MRIQDENPIIDALLEQGYHIEEVRDIIVHIHEEIMMRKESKFHTIMIIYETGSVELKWTSNGRGNH